MPTNTKCKPGTVVPCVVPHKGWELGYKPHPKPPKPADPAELAFAVGELVVKATQGKYMPLEEVVEALAWDPPFEITKDELREEIAKVSALWRDDKGPDVPKWEPPKPPEPTPVVVEDPIEDPEPK